MTSTPIEILFEDAEALVINKPAGLPVDRPRKGGECLEDHLDALRFGFQRQPLPVHRLDTDTSGCLLLARNPKAHKRFARSFEEKLVSKSYIAILDGVPEAESGTIELALSKISSEAKGWRMIAAKKGKPSVTHWERIAVMDCRSVVRFRPETGRTHQLRIHALAGLKIALLGDPIYGSGQGAPRTMLHAESLTMPRANKSEIIASAPIPDDFRNAGYLG